MTTTALSLSFDDGDEPLIVHLSTDDHSPVGVALSGLRSGRLGFALARDEARSLGHALLAIAAAPFEEPG